jgi:hypothetical protein
MSETKSTEKWSPTPWQVDSSGSLIKDANGISVCDTFQGSVETAISDAARIVECVIFCAGIGSVWMQSAGSLKQVKDDVFKAFQERDQLTAENQALKEEKERLESSLREQAVTFEFGARVMNEVVLPASIEVNSGEFAIDALKRWKQERDQLQSSLKEMTRLRDEAVKEREGLEAHAARIIGQLKSQLSKAQEEWIRVEDRLPRPGFFMEIWIKGSNLPSVGMVMDENGHWVDRNLYDIDAAVTHWRKLPEPPQ